MPPAKRASRPPVEKSQDRSGTKVLTDNPKLNAVQGLIESIVKIHGEKSIFMLGDSSHMNVDAISTGSITVDIATGIGGVPRGRIVEIYGPESSGKTTVCLQIIAESQRNGGYCAFIDMEHALDPKNAREIGVDMDHLLVSQPDTGEDALGIAEMVVVSGACDVVVIDSVAALTPRIELEGEMGDSHVGLQARLMSQALRKLSAAISQTKTIVIFTNQLRDKIGVTYGSPEVTTGGKALKFYASLRFDIRKLESIKGAGGEIIGIHSRIRVVKNKVAPPFREAEFDIMFAEGGISRTGEIIDIAAELDIIKKRGAWYNYGDIQVGQGRENSKKYLREHPDFAFMIENMIREAKGLPKITVVPVYGGKTINKNPALLPLETNDDVKHSHNGEYIPDDVYESDESDISGEDLIE